MGDPLDAPKLAATLERRPTTSFPAGSGWQDRSISISICIIRHGQLDFFHYDPLGQAARAATFAVYTAPMTLRLYLPLAGFVLPTVIIGYGYVIPNSCIAGVNELTIGFALTIVSAAATYVAGVRMALATARPPSKA